MTTTSSNTIKINIVGQVSPTVTIVSPTSNLCTGETATFTATAINAGTSPSYEWKINGVAAGGNTKTFTTSTLANGDIVNCGITTDPLFTCAITVTAVSNDITVNVHEKMSPSTTITASGNEVCFGELLIFSAATQNAGAVPTYQWQLNNENVGNSSLVYSNNRLQNGDEIYCIVTPGNDVCFDSPDTSNTIKIKVNYLPVVDIIPTDTIIPISSHIQLITVVSGSISSFKWGPADKLEDPLTLTPTTIDLANDTKYILAVTSDAGCTASKSAVVKVFTDVYMPGGFTPNGDSKNDLFRIPPNVSLSLTEFSIYDRWGNRIFSTKDKNKGWDGTTKGEKASTGVYVYLIKGSNQKGRVFLKGTFVLIR